LFHRFRSPCRPGIEGRRNGKGVQGIGRDGAKAIKTLGRERVFEGGKQNRH
jgi:hypothetical protein